MGNYKFNANNKSTKRRRYTFNDVFHPNVSNSEHMDEDAEEQSEVLDSATLVRSYETRFKPWRAPEGRPFKLNQKQLLDSEIQEYKRFGKPDLDQNFLELFTPEVVDDMFTILNFGSDNFKKASMMLDELKFYGFEEVGEGTNILVVHNPYYPGVVFKIALDSNGIADNFNDEILCNEVPRYAKAYARHSSGIVSVQERYAMMTEERMKDFKDRILWLLSKLSKRYLVADLSPSRFLNFGVGRDGDFIIIDGSDLYPLEQITEKIRCTKNVGWDDKKKQVIKCGGHLEYSYDYLSLICKKCGRVINPLEVRPKKESDNMSQYSFDGTSPEQRDAWEQEETEAIRKRCGEKDIAEQGETPDYKDSEEQATVVEQVLEQGDSDEEEVPTDQTDVHEEEPVDAKPDDESEADGDDESDDEDESGSIEVDTMIPSAPPSEQSQDDQTPVEEDKGPQAEMSITDDSQPDPDEDDQEEVVSEDENSEEVSQPDDDRDHEPKDPVDGVEFLVKPINEDGSNEEYAGIYVKVSGDFEKAWENDGIPIYLSVNGSSTMVVVSFNAFKTILERGVAEIKEEEEADERYRKERRLAESEGLEDTDADLEEQPVDEEE